MANVETEQNASPVPSQSTDGPASVAVIEENLAALLNAVTAPPSAGDAVANVPQAAAPVPIAAVETRSPVVESTSITERPREVDRTPAQEPPPAADFVDRLEPLSKDVRPFEPAPLVREIAPAVEPQQEVVSKLALLSSIKQRRAVAMRPEFGNAFTAEPDLAAAAKPAPGPANASPAEASTDALVGDKQAFSEQKPHQVTEKAPVVPAVKVERDSTEKKPEPLPVPAVYPSRTSALFAPAEETSSREPKNFATSGAGLTLIGGSILGLCLIAYLFIGHGPKTTPGSAQPVATAPAQTAQAVAPARPEAAATEKPAVTAAATVLPPAKKDEKAAPKVDATPTAKPAIEPPSANASDLANAESTTSAKTNSAPVARVFTPPVPGRKPPTDDTIREAPPALSAPAATIPSIATLPSGIAPPPSPAKTSGPREINVPAKVQASKLARSVTPAYPSLAKATRVQGTVRFRVTIGTDGQVKGLMLLGGPPPLVQAAADAIRQWRYQPTVVNGERVEVITEIEVAFRL